jgi:IMP dehydrogenase/GMP reductase
MTDVPLALTFDDVLIVPRRSGVRSRRDVDTAGRLTRRLTLKVPVLSANMDTVTEWRLAAAMAREGGIGIIHRFMTIDQEVAEIARVKRPEEYGSARSNYCRCLRASRALQHGQLVGSRRLTEGAGYSDDA